MLPYTVDWTEGQAYTNVVKLNELYYIGQDSTCKLIYEV